MFQGLSRAEYLAIFGAMGPERKSTSFLQMNGDKGYAKALFPIYFGINYLGNRDSHQLQDRADFDVRKFRLSISEDDWAGIDRLSSPSRILSDLFWNRLPWEIIDKVIGTPNLVDVGCGRGYLLKKIIDSRGDDKFFYRGVDKIVRSSWVGLSSANRNVRFLCGSAGHIEEYLDGDQNFIISQSALEHLEHDLKFFKTIQNYSESRSAPTLHIHCMPAARCLWLYGLHGYRQYTQYRIRRLIEPFGNSISGILYELGGDRCATVHREFISGFPFLCRKETRELHEVEYTTSVRHAILADMCEDSVSGPLFYAVVFLNKRFADLLKAFI